MPFPRFKSYLLLFVTLGAFVFVDAQEEKKTSNPVEAAEASDDEVLKVSSSLIQTGITVFDKKGVFVEGLRPEDFELSIDGKPVPVSFFEFVGGAPAKTNEKTRAARTNVDKKSANGTAVRRGRNILFMIDDLHLSFDSNRRTRDLILRFIDQQLDPEDWVAIVSSSGRIGFLQQFTNDALVLKEAVARLVNSRDTSTTDRMSPPMSLYEAQLIDRRDPEMTDLFAALLVKEMGGMDLEAARESVRQRARSILQYAGSVNINTYNALEQSIRRSAGLPGRKTVFFISDGFLLDAANTQANYRLQRITDAATRANAVVYSFDAKGLDAALPETTSNSFRAQAGERFEGVDPLNAVAEGTGGRLVRNTNDMQTELIRAFEESAVYYLLAWEPDAEDAQSEKLKKIEVSVKNRPDLKVRLQAGYLNEKKIIKNADAKKAPNPLPPAEREIRAALVSQTPLTALPTFLAVHYLDSPAEPNMLSVALKIDGAAMQFLAQGGKSIADVALLGNVYDADGKRVGGFNKVNTQELNTVDPALVKSERRDVFFNYKIANLKPGWYQVRVASRDAKSGVLGSAAQWIKIPDLASRKLALSSLLLAGGNDSDRSSAAKNDGAEISVDRIFAENSNFRYLIFIYNAARGKSGAPLPDVTIRTQILSGRSVLLESPARPVSVEGQEPGRIAYAADISLKNLPAGRYFLRVVIRDRVAKDDAVQQVGFEIK